MTMRDSSDMQQRFVCAARERLDDERGVAPTTSMPYLYHTP